MARSRIKNVDVTKRTDNQCLDARYKNGNPPSPLDIVIATIPNLINLTAGSAYSEDFDALYVTGADSSGATYSLELSVGSLGAIDLAFSGAGVLSGSTPDEDTITGRLVVSKSGQEFRSNVFTRTFVAAQASDTLAPAIPPPPSATVIDFDQVDLQGHYSMDPVTSAISADGMQNMVLRRATVTGGVEGSFSDIQTINAASDGFTGLFQQVTIGNPGTGSVSQSGASYTVSHGYGQMGGTLDDCVVGTWAVSGNFTLMARLADFDNQGDAFSASMIGVRLDDTQGAPYIRLRRFNVASGKGISYVIRTAQNGTTSASTAVTTNIPTDVWVMITRVGTSYSCYFIDTQGTLVQIGTTQTIAALNSSVKCFFTAFRPSVGTNISAQIQNVSINTLGVWTFSDTTVSQNTTYSYRLRGRDDANNLSAESISSVFVQTPVNTNPGVQKKWDPGWIVLLDNFADNATLRAKHLAPTWNQSTDDGHIIELVNMPNVKAVKLLIYWGSLEIGETLGTAQYDFTLIDQYLAACQAAGKKLFLSVFPITFNNVTDAAAHGGRFFPRYISENSTTYGITKLVVPGYMARTWKTAVNDRLIALHDAIATAYDDDPWFYGCQTEETSINVANGTDGFSVAAYETALINQFEAYASAFSKSQVRCSTNYFNGGDASGQTIIAAAAANGIGCGGPDILPKEVIAANRIFSGYTGGIDYRGAGPYTPGTGGANVMPWYSEIQLPEMGSGKEGDFDMTRFYRCAIYGESYNSGTNGLGSQIIPTLAGMRPMNPNHFVIYRNTSSATAPATFRLKWYPDLKPFINANIGYGSSAYTTSQPS